VTTCPCACHGGNNAFPTPCDIPGGCHAYHREGDSSAPAEQRCRRGSSCLAEEEVDGEIRGARTDTLLCRRCTEAVGSALRDAPKLYVQLRQRIRVQGTAAGGEQVTRSKGQPLPLNASALDLTDQVHWLAATWADVVITAAGRPRPDRTSQPEAQQIDDACYLLDTYLDVWLDHPAVVLQVTTDTQQEQAGWEAAGLLLDWKRSARRNLGIATLVHRPPEPCPACNVPGVLERRDGDDKVRCTNCHKAWTLAMYETFVHAWMGAAS
jgi:hypothetical protein